MPANDKIDNAILHTIVTLYYLHPYKQLCRNCYYIYDGEGDHETFPAQSMEEITKALQTAVKINFHIFKY